MRKRTRTRSDASNRSSTAAARSSGKAEATRAHRSVTTAPTTRQRTQSAAAHAHGAEKTYVGTTGVSKRGGGGGGGSEAALQRALADAFAPASRRGGSDRARMATGDDDETGERGSSNSSSTTRRRRESVASKKRGDDAAAVDAEDATYSVDAYGKGCPTDRLQFGYAPANADEAVAYHSRYSAQEWVTQRRACGRLVFVRKLKLEKSNCEPFTSVLKLQQHWRALSQFQHELRGAAGSGVTDAAAGAQRDADELVNMLASRQRLDEHVTK